MMKKYKNYLIMAGVIILLAAAFFIINGIDTEEKPPEIDVPVSTEILNLSASEISELSVSNGEGVFTFVFEDEKVSVKELPNAFIDSDKADSLKSKLSYITTYNIIEAAENERYGLDNPGSVANITMKDGKTYTLAIGDKAPDSSGYYAEVADDGRIFILGTGKAEALLEGPSYYRTKTFFVADTGTVSSITLEVKNKHTVEFREAVVPNPEVPHNVFTRFNMISPYNWPATSDIVSNIIKSVSDIQVAEYSAESLENMADFGFTPYSARITLIHDGGKEDTVLFGGSKDGIIYIRVNDDPGIYGVYADAYAYLENDPFSYLSTFAFIKNIDTVKKINYKHNDVMCEFTVTKKDEEVYDVTKNGKLMSQKAFQEMYTELISISIAGEYEGAVSGMPFLTYTFTYNDGTSEVAEYYAVDERRAALSIGGKVQFYVSMTSLNERLEKIDAVVKAQ